MNKISKGLGIGLMALVAGCSTPKGNQELPSNSYIEFSPRDQRVIDYKNRFNTLYEGARESLDSYERNRGSRNAVSERIAEDSLRNYKDYFIKMTKIIGRLDESGDDTSSLRELLIPLK